MNDTEVSLKFTNNITGEKKLERYANNLAKINTMLKGLDKGMISQLESSSDSIQTISKGMSKTKNISEGLFSTAKIIAFTKTIKGLANNIMRLTSISATYLENMNLLDVAYKNDRTSADKFVNTLSEMYGLDESWGYRTVGIFKQLANAMGLADEVGTKLAETMTSFSIDIASLYNMDTSDAVSILQSALAGQTKPARRLGADITQTTLQTTLDQADIDKNITNLSYVEKRLLIVTSLLNQVKEANGDWGRTIESVANQTRIMSEQWNRLSRAIGNVFLPVIKQILPYINAVLMVLTELFTMLASLVGFKQEDFDYFEGTNESAIEFGDNLDSAGKSAKKLKQGLRGFDKLNVITTPSSGGAGAGGGSFGGTDPKILDLFNKATEEYNKKLEQVQMKATKIRDSIMEWLGFTKYVDEETGKVSFKFDHITSGTVLGALGVGGSIFLGITKILKVFQKLGLIKLPTIATLFGEGGTLTKASSVVKSISTALGAINPLVLGIAALIALVIGAFADLYSSTEEFKTLVDETFGGIASDVGSFFGETIEYGKEQFKKLKEIGLELKDKVLSPLWQLIKDNLKPVFEGLLRIISSLWNNIIKPALPYLKEVADKILPNTLEHIKTLISVLGTIISKLKTLYDDWIRPIAEFIWNILVKRIEKISEAIKEVIDFIGKIKEKWNEAKKYLDEHFKLPELKMPKFPKIKLKIEYDTNVGSAKKAVYEALGLDGWPKLKFETYAKGGLPPVGQMFIANEKGPELVGQIGGKSFVANQNQMMDLLDKKISTSSNGIKNATFVIKVGDKEIARQVITDLQDMAKTNGMPITIGD